MSAPAAVEHELRCHRCSMLVGRTPSPLQIVGVFKGSEWGTVRSLRADEVKRRCRSCGWINVFHPLTGTGHFASVEVKSHR